VHFLLDSVLHGYIWRRLNQRRRFLKCWFNRTNDFSNSNSSFRLREFNSFNNLRFGLQGRLECGGDCSLFFFDTLLHNDWDTWLLSEFSRSLNHHFWSWRLFFDGNGSGRIRSYVLKRVVLLLVSFLVIAASSF